MTHSELAQMARNENFQRRIQYLMVKAALAKLNAETPSQADILLGQKILNGEEPLPIWTVAALTNPAIAAGAHALDGSTITDNDLEFSVNSLWAAFSL